MAGKQNEAGTFEDFKKNANFTYAFCYWHMLAVVMPLRDRWGVEALGFGCFLSLCLMALWYVFTADPLMLVWMCVWGVSWVIRKMEAAKLNEEGAPIHSQWTGQPRFALRFCKTGASAVRWGEPFILGGLGVLLFLFYQHTDRKPTGLPYFLMFSFMSLPVVVTVQNRIWEKRIQAMRDQQLEQELLVKDYQKRFGQ